ncbi:hypothetical protein R9D66_004276 [Citrobacter amalonaticus]|nr:hypothetical protein [Citrobacter amalonaticus]
MKDSKKTIYVVTQCYLSAYGLISLLKKSHADLNIVKDIDELIIKDNQVVKVVIILDLLNIESLKLLKDVTDFISELKKQ